MRVHECVAVVVVCLCQVAETWPVAAVHVCVCVCVAVHPCQYIFSSMMLFKNVDFSCCIHLTHDPIKSHLQLSAREKARGVPSFVCAVCQAGLCSDIKRHKKRRRRKLLETVPANRAAKCGIKVSTAVSQSAGR